MKKSILELAEHSPTTHALCCKLPVEANRAFLIYDGRITSKTYNPASAMSKYLHHENLKRSKTTLECTMLAKAAMLFNLAHSTRSSTMGNKLHLSVSYAPENIRRKEEGREHQNGLSSQSHNKRARNWTWEDLLEVVLLTLHENKEFFHITIRDRRSINLMGFAGF